MREDFSPFKIITLELDIEQIQDKLNKNTLTKEELAKQIGEKLLSTFVLSK